MRDLNRKVEKFLKAKEITSASTKASRDSALTPHVIYGVSSAPKTSAKIKNNLSTRGFSMTVSFFNPRFDKATFPKEFAIRHEDKKKNMIATSPDSSPVKRDPILQDNSEQVREPRSCIKFTPLSARTTLFTEEQVYSKKIAGEFNHVYNARSQSPKVESIRTNIPKRSDSPDEPRRVLRAVKTPHLIKPNPITEGDLAGVAIRKERLAPEISEETKKINDRKTVLYADREASKKGKVFRDTNVNFEAEVNAETSKVSSKTDRGFLGARLGSPITKREDSISGLLEYKHALTYRDQGVSDKCNNVPMSNLMRVAEV